MSVGCRTGGDDCLGLPALQQAARIRQKRECDMGLRSSLQYLSLNSQWFVSRGLQDGLCSGGCAPAGNDCDIIVLDRRPFVFYDLSPIFKWRRMKARSLRPEFIEQTTRAMQPSFSLSRAVA